MMDVGARVEVRPTKHRKHHRRLAVMGAVPLAVGTAKIMCADLAAMSAAFVFSAEHPKINETSAPLRVSYI